MIDKLITVIIPVYKVEAWLNRCVESVINQTYRHLEIILVDDGSPDKCPEMCDEWAKRDRRIRVIHKENAGLSAARNDGIRMANGEYILYVDSDDYIQLDACERFAKYADGVDIVIGEALITEPTQVIHRVHTNLDENRVYSGEEYARVAISKGEWFAAACYNFYKVQFLLENDLFFHEGLLHEDIEYIPRLFLAAKTVKYMHYEFYNYIIREDSITSKIGKKHFDDLMTIYSLWAGLNERIKNPETKKAYCGALAKYYMATCRDHKVKKRNYPNGLNSKYLRQNSLNLKEYIKAVVFSISQRFYVNL